MLRIRRFLFDVSAWMPMNLTFLEMKSPDS